MARAGDSVTWIVVLLGLVAVMSAGGEVEGGCLMTAGRELVACFQQQGLRLDVRNDSLREPGDLVRQLQILQSDVFCQHKGEYRSAVTCTVGVLESCLKPFHMSEALPSLENMLQGFEVKCRDKDKLDSVCYNKQLKNIQECGHQEVMNSLDKHKDVNVTGLVCLSTEIHYDCTKKHAAPCGPDTVRIMLDLLNNYYLPQVCHDRRPGRSDRQTFYASQQSAATPSLFYSHIAVHLLLAVASLVLLLQ